MVTFLRSRVWRVVVFFGATLLAYPPSAIADRVDIDDPSILGPVLRREFIYWDTELAYAFAEVRYVDGFYSYVYGVSSNPYFPGTSCCEAGIVSFAVTGHPLEGTWGAIAPSRVASITPVHDGFLVIPIAGGFTMMYMQLPLRPSRDGTFTYTGHVRDWDTGEPIDRTESSDRHGVLAPVPEPASVVLFGLGLAGLAARRYAHRHRGTAESH